MNPAGAGASADVVGQWRDTAEVSYTQDRSAHTAYSYNQTIQDLFIYGLAPQTFTSNVSDFDGSPARWSVSYEDGGRREFWILDGRTGSNTVGFSNIPVWAEAAGARETMTDASGLPAYAPIEYFEDTASLLQTYAVTRGNVAVGQDPLYVYHPMRYEYVSTPVYWTDAYYGSLKKGGALATPRNRWQNAGVSAAAGDNAVWLAGYYSHYAGYWAWQLSGYYQFPPRITWFNWNGGEPNFAGGSQQCIMMWNHSPVKGLWNDAPPTYYALPYVVQYEPYWESRTITETQYDYTYDWASQWHEITDQRLIYQYHWASQVETLTDRTGMEEVVVGTRFYTMDVTLTQDGYWNPDAPEDSRFREYFIEGIDYVNENITWTPAEELSNRTFTVFERIPLFSGGDGAMIPDLDLFFSPGASFTQDAEENYLALLDAGVHDIRIVEVVDENTLRIDWTSSAELTDQTFSVYEKNLLV
jgi:hypothetical protein